ncbi:MAG: BppU family phage baseplate upper protein [Sarcina sp.]
MRDYKISLDIIEPIIELDEIWFVKDDIGGFIEIELKDNNTLIDLIGMKVLVIFEKKDKTITQKEATILDSSNGLIKLNMLNSIIDIPGKIKTEIKIYKGEQEKVTFAPFSIIVKKSISMDDVVESYIELDIVQEVNKNTAAILNNSKAIARNAEDINTLNSNLQAMAEGINVFSNEVVESFESFNKVVNENKEVAELGINNLVGELEKTNKNLSNSNSDITTLQETKANIIISLEEPDHTNLSLGTIWIKPMVQDE